MVVTLKCGNESTFFSNSDANVEIESEATDGSIEVINNTKIEITNSSNGIIASTLTQGLLNATTMAKTRIFNENTSSAVIYATQNVINCICNRNCQSANRTDNLPSSGNLISAIHNCQVGSSFYFTLRNTGTNNLLTLNTALGGITLNGTANVPFGTSSNWLFIVTDVAGQAISGYLVSKSPLIFAYDSTDSLTLTDGYLMKSSITPTNLLPMARASNGGGPAWSYSLWIKSLDNTPLDAKTIIAFGSNDMLTSINLVSKNNKSIQLRYGDFAGGLLTFQSNQGTLAFNIWTHILITFDGGTTGNDSAEINDYYGRFKMYIDGKIQTTTKGNSSFGYTGAFAIEKIAAGRASTAGTSFDGRVDEIAVWDVDVTSIKNEIYNDGETHNLLTLKFPPVHWWKIETATDDLPTSVADVIGGVDLPLVLLDAADVTTDVPPTLHPWNSMSVRDGTLTLSGLSSGFPMRRENNTGTGWTYTFYFRANSTIGSGDHSLLAAGLLNIGYNRDNKRVFFKYGDATNFLMKTTANDSIVDDVWTYLSFTLSSGDLGNNSGDIATYYGRMKMYIGKIESTDTESNGNFGIADATNQFTSMVIGSNIGHISWVTIDDNERGVVGIQSLYNNGELFNLFAINNNPEFWVGFHSYDVSPNVVPAEDSIGGGNLVMSGGSAAFDTVIFPDA